MPHCVKKLLQRKRSYFSSHLSIILLLKNYQTRNKRFPLKQGYHLCTESRVNNLKIVTALVTVIEGKRLTCFVEKGVFCFLMFFENFKMERELRGVSATRRCRKIILKIFVDAATSRRHRARLSLIHSSSTTYYCRSNYVYVQHCKLESWIMLDTQDRMICNRLICRVALFSEQIF